MKSYIANVLLGFDLFVSAVCGGMPGETLSGRAGTAQAQGKLRGKIFAPVIDAIMHICGAYPTWSGHCQHAIQGDILRAKAVITDDSKVVPLRKP